MLSSFRVLLARDGARPLALACALGWLSMCAYAIAIVLAVHAATRSFAVAGFTLAAFSVGSGVVAPLRGRLIDRHGPPVLARVAVVHLAAGLAVALACALRAPGGVIVAIAVGLGVSSPPIIATARTMWSAVAGERLAPTAHAFNSMLADLGVMAGPALAGALAVAITPAVALGAVITGAAAAAVLVSRGPARARAAASPPAGGDVWGLLRESAGLRTLVAGDLLTGVWLSGLEVAVLAVAAAHGTAALGAIPIAASAVGSIGAAAWVGSRRSDERRRRPAVETRYVAGMALVAIALPLTLVSVTLPAIAVVLVLTGAGFGLFNVALFELLDTVVAPGRETEAFTWLTTSQAAGGAAGAAVAGHLAQASPTGALLMVCGAAVLGAVIAPVRRRTLAPAGRGRTSGRPAGAMPAALVIVDFQNDFTPGGALGVPHGDELAPRINALAASGTFALVVATRDRHPADHGSFVSEGGIWPVHCVAGTEGAELHPALDRARIDVLLDKGEDPATDGYSAFDGTGLAAILRERGIDAVTVVGLATDYCVKHTALDAVHAGLRVSVDPRAVAGVDVESGDSARALDELARAGVAVDG